MKRINYNKGDIVGNLIFLKDVNNSRPRKAWFSCPLCKTEFITEISRSKSLHVISCGCFRKTNSKQLHLKHGHTVEGKMSSEYVSWQRMIQRCINIGYGNYYRYGGRGIQVCDRWRNSFEEFLSDMGVKPFKGAQIDRKDPNGNYEPSNCRWISSKENSRNKNNNLKIIWKKETKTLSEWSEILNINKNTLRNRIYSTQWTLEEAMSTPLLKRGKNRKTLL